MNASLPEPAGRGVCLMEGLLSGRVLDHLAGSTVLVNRALIVILATVVLDAVGIGLALPVIPSLLRELSHETRIAGRFGYFMAIYPFMQFLFSPVLGRLSDRFGRRPVLLVSLGVATVDYLIMGLSPLLAVLYVGRALAGMTGANLAVATAYIADISGPDERARRFGYMNACFGLGFVAGPLLGGLVGSVSPRYPFLLAALCSGLNLMRRVCRDGADHEGMDGVRGHAPLHRGRGCLAGVPGAPIAAGERGASGRVAGDAGQPHESDRGRRADRRHEYLRRLAAIGAWARLARGRWFVCALHSGHRSADGGVSREAG